MSAFGGPDPMADVARQLEDLTRALEDSTRATQDSTRETKADTRERRSGGGGGGGVSDFGPLGFAANRANKLIGGVARAGVAQGMTESIASGANLGTALGHGILSQLASKTGIGADIVDPLGATVGRVGGITTSLARAGVQVSDEQRQFLFDFFAPQERRADRESRAVRAQALTPDVLAPFIAESGVSSKIAAGVAFSPYVAYNIASRLTSEALTTQGVQTR